jgi:hypothetical protein
MDDGRFDDLTRRLAVLGTRRASLRAMAAVALAGGLNSRQPAAAGVCRAAGKQCAEHSDCCSLECKKTKGKKKKNGKRKKGKKTCRGNGLVLLACVGNGGDCSGAGECCGSLICDPPQLKCCGPLDFPCSSNADCCDDYGAVCGIDDGGTSRCCKPEGVFWTVNKHCCSGHCDSDLHSCAT